MKIKNLFCSFDYNLYLVHSCTEAQFVKYVNKITQTQDCILSGARGKISGYSNKENTWETLIWIKEEGEKASHRLGAIYHEVGHALICIFEEMGSRINKETDEVFLYTQEDLVNQILAILKK